MCILIMYKLGKKSQQNFIITADEWQDSFFFMQLLNNKPTIFGFDA